MAQPQSGNSAVQSNGTVSRGKKRTREERERTNGNRSDCDDDESLLEMLCERVKANPTDSTALRSLRTAIRRLYKQHPGLKINTNDVMPVNLDSLTGTQLINVLENMELQSAGGDRKEEVVSRGLNMIQNVTRSVSIIRTGRDMPQAQMSAINGDSLLSEALAMLFVGKTNPFMNAFIAITEHLSSALLQHTISRNGIPRVDPRPVQ